MNTKNLMGFGGLVLLTTILAACAGSSGGGGGNTPPPPPPSTSIDRDGDGIADAEDNCPRTPNRDQANLDNQTEPADGELGVSILGDACDPDIDGDGRANDRDDFPRDRTEQDDTDDDGMGDNSDSCPTISDTSCRGIATAGALAGNLSADPEGNYWLAADITLSGWVAVDFNGTLNGGGSRITISGSSDPLFDTIGADGRVLNLGILEGTLANMNHGTITGSYTTGDSVCTEDDCVSGGLVWQNTGTITNSYATGDSRCTRAGCISGGLVGRNLGTITNSYVSGSIEALRRGGGLVGENRGNITDSYANGDSRCTQAGCNSGGLVAENLGTIINSYTTGSSMGIDNIGGLVGTNSGSIINSYAVGNVSSKGSAGGLVGRQTATGRIRNSFANGTNRCYVDTRDGNLPCRTGGLIGTNDGGMVIDSHANGNSNSSCVNVESTCSSGGLIGFALASNIISAYATGNSYCQIPVARSSCSSCSCQSGGLIGNVGGGIQITKSYAIGNSYCSTSSPATVACRSGGMIGVIGSAAADSIINNSYATGNSSAIMVLDGAGVIMTGGLVGQKGANSRIENSYATGNSNTSCRGGDCTSGGLVGLNSGAIVNSYAIGNSSLSGNGNTASGGLIGFPDTDTTITRSYRVQNTGTSTDGDNRTLAQLRCPTSPGDSDCTPTTYDGWDDAIWNFGTNTDLPTLFDLPDCPSFRPNCRH